MKKIIIILSITLVFSTLIFGIDDELMDHFLHSEKYVLKGDYLFAKGNSKEKKSTLIEIKSYLEQELKKDKDDPDALGNLAYVYYYLDLPDKALEYGLNSIKSGTKDPRFFNIVGNIYHEKNDYTNATLYYNKALGYDDENKTALYNLSIVNLNNNDTEKSLNYIKKLMDIDEEYKDASYVLGRLYQLKNDFKKAVKYYKIELSNDPYHSAANYYLGQIAEKEETDTDQVIHYYYNALASDPFNQEIRKDLIRMYNKKGSKSKKLAEDESRLLKLKKMDGTLYNYAQYLFKSGRQESRMVKIMFGIFVMEMLLKKYPDYPCASQALGAAYMQMNKIEKAEMYFEKEMKLNPNNVELWYNKAAMLYHKYKKSGDKNDLNEAKKMLEKCILIDPLDEDSLEFFKKVNKE